MDRIGTRYDDTYQPGATNNGYVMSDGNVGKMGTENSGYVAPPEYFDDTSRMWSAIKQFYQLLLYSIGFNLYTFNMQ